MGAGINNVIYMELYSGPKMANGRCGKTIDTGTIDRGSTVYTEKDTHGPIISAAHSAVKLHIPHSPTGTRH